MQIIREKKELADLILSYKKEHKTIGFVPTMGALHQGHISLVERAKEENDIVVVSVFVNPIQFNNPHDLQTYPRSLEKDVCMLTKVGCDLVFSPSEEEMYPKQESIQENFDFGLLEQVMEGASRPGHFFGVAVVVSRLFLMVNPDRAYFGEKDFQQLAIIQKMVRQRDFKVQVIPCPILRENDGLAMSSRNVRLSPEQREKAPQIYQVLKASNELVGKLSPQELKNWVLGEYKRLNLDVEYFEIANAITLESLTEWEKEQGSVGCVVVHFGNVRLIDNIKYF